MKILRVGEHQCKVGESAEENWSLLDKAKKKHWFFHLTDFPSCYIILECEKDLDSEDKYACAEICVSHSKQKKNKCVKVDVTLCRNVIKSDDIGECEYKNEKQVEEIVVTECKGGLPAGVEDISSPKKSSKKEPAPPPAPKVQERPDASTIVGEYITVKKHGTMGCALVIFEDPAARSAVLEFANQLEEPITIGDSSIRVKLQPQVDKASGQEVPTEIFAAWGRQVEKETPLSEAELLDTMENLRRQLTAKVAKPSQKGNGKSVGGYTKGSGKGSGKSAVAAGGYSSAGVTSSPPKREDDSSHAEVDSILGSPAKEASSNKRREKKAGSSAEEVPIDSRDSTQIVSLNSIEELPPGMGPAVERHMRACQEEYEVAIDKAETRAMEMETQLNVVQKDIGVLEAELATLKGQP